MEKESDTFPVNDGQDAKIITLLDSLDFYIKLYQSLSNSLREGWLDIASARYSIGVSRISEPLFSLKPRSAYALVTVQSREDGDADVEDENAGAVGQAKPNPSFILHMWNIRNDDSEVNYENSSAQLRRRIISPDKSKAEPVNIAALESDTNSKISTIQKQRSEALSLFGTLVPPKLRSAQSSFENALETLLEIANVRNAILLISEELKRERERTIAQTDCSRE